ncbi:MAG: hypothetical protein KJZ85_08395 [Rhodobacteraceae bacterium]|jgi:hypothetical protein|nr:hypothetical protein [Paracoccaceae bacterium]
MLVFLGQPHWLAGPGSRTIDPLRTEGSAVATGLIGVFIAGLGAMLAIAAQMSMGTSWRGGLHASRGYAPLP